VSILNNDIERRREENGKRCGDLSTGHGKVISMLEAAFQCGGGIGILLFRAHTCL
jgi:hypothetical protein